MPPSLPGRWGDLLPRAVSGLVMIGLALGTAMTGGVVFKLFWLIATAAIAWEWQRLIGRERLAIRVVTAVAALVAVVSLATPAQSGIALLALALGVLATVLVAPSSLRAMAGAGTLYASAPLLAVIVLRQSGPYALDAILWLFAVVWGTDIMAYFAGRLIGGPKLWPRLSPAKTWSGFLVGVACGALAGVAASWGHGSPVAVVLIGLLTGAAAQGGDLFESSFKRRYGVKDASHIIPGHGGVMDRLDGFIAASVLAACLGVAHAGAGAAGAGLLQW